jgi:hypothetical protein
VKILVRLSLVLCVFVAAAFARPAPASADTSCYTGTASQWTTATVGLLYFYPLCNSSGALVTSGGGGGGGSGTANTPYNGTTGQTISNTSGLIAGGVYNLSQPTYTAGAYVPGNYGMDGRAYVNIDPYQTFITTPGTAGTLALNIQQATGSNPFTVNATIVNTTPTDTNNYPYTHPQMNPTDAPLQTNVQQYGGTAVVTGGSAGVPSVGGSVAIGGVAGGANPLQQGCRSVTNGTNPTAQTTNNVVDYNDCNAQGIPWTMIGGPNNWVAHGTITSTTAVIIRAASPSLMSNSVYDLHFQWPSTQTVGLITVSQGTGAGCATGNIVIDQINVAAGVGSFATTYTIPISTNIALAETCLQVSSATSSLFYSVTGVTAAT